MNHIEEQSQGVDAQDKKIRELLTNHEIEILVVCMHGRSRSKAVAKILRDKYKYSSAKALGIKDPQVPDKDKVGQLTRADLIVVVESDVRGEILFRLSDSNRDRVTQQILMFPLSNKEHQALSSDIGMKYNRTEALSSIENRLLEYGFIKSEE